MTTSLLFAKIYSARTLHDMRMNARAAARKAAQLRLLDLVLVE
jgi:hypothetical protein